MYHKMSYIEAAAATERRTAEDQSHAADLVATQRDHGEMTLRAPPHRRSEDLTVRVATILESSETRTYSATEPSAISLLPGSWSTRP
jgi:hypothetical protein